MNIHFDYQLAERASPLQARSVKEAISTLYALVGANASDHFVFTSSGAEAVNHAVLAAYFDITRKTGKNHFLCSSLDEAPVMMAMSRLQEAGSVFQMIPANDLGKVSKKAVLEMITPRTAMISLSWANAFTGVIQPLQEIAELCRERDILLHVEATHVLGKGSFTFEESGADILTFNGFPAGTGGLFFRENSPISPLILGGVEQDGMRAGSYSISQLVELAKWAKQELAERDHYGVEIARLRTLFETLVCQQIAGAKVLFHEEQRTPHTTCFLCPGASSDAIAYLLAQKGIHVAIGGNRFQWLHEVLKGCGIQEPDCYTGLPVTLSAETSEEEVIVGVQELAQAVSHLQNISEKVWHGCS